MQFGDLREGSEISDCVLRSQGTIMTSQGRFCDPREGYEILGRFLRSQEGFLDLRDGSEISGVVLRF